LKNDLLAGRFFVYGIYFFVGAECILPQQKIPFKQLEGDLIGRLLFT